MNVEVVSRNDVGRVMGPLRVGGGGGSGSAMIACSPSSVSVSFVVSVSTPPHALASNAARSTEVVRGLGEKGDGIVGMGLLGEVWTSAVVPKARRAPTASAGPAAERAALGVTSPV
jgi:hypothetical protein